MTVSFYTLGCKVNQYESQAISELFEAKGYTVLPTDSVADIIVVNSCTVTAESNRKTRQVVRRFRRLAPNSVIVLTGCMVQAFFDEAQSILEADVVIGNTDYDRFVQTVEEFLSTRERICRVAPHTREEKFTELNVCRFSEHTRANIKIEDGCNRFCSYCIIPYARGRVRSRSVESIKNEAKALALAGYKEVVLVGINLSAYGQDISAELCDAVEAAASVKGIERVRLGSLECDQISDEALDRLAACEKFCPQFHLSLQSGCDKTLKEMNRKYDKAFYRDLVARIRRVFKEPSITTDVMVGFSGETDDDFKESLDFVKEIGFMRAHVFIYSVREGTKAALRTDQVDRQTKLKRSKMMIEATEQSEKEFLLSQVGKTFGVLFETSDNSFWYGYTENYTRVAVPSTLNLEGKILKVLIQNVKDGLSFGKLT